MNIHFEKAKLSHQELIFNWLKEPHIKEFWDNSQEHKDDIVNFMNGHIEPSNYCDGLYFYWVGFVDNQPYCLTMTLQEQEELIYLPLKRLISQSMVIPTVWIT